MILNIGCGNEKIKDCINADININVKPNVVCDVNYLPFKDNAFDCVVVSHLLEHVDDIVMAMNEIGRVLETDGDLMVMAPEFPHWSALADPTHKRFFVAQSFEYLGNPNKLPGLKYGFKTISLQLQNISKEDGKTVPQFVWAATKL